MVDRVGFTSGLLVASASLLVGCSRPKPSADPNGDWFRENQTKLAEVRTMILLDSGLVDHVGLAPTGALRSAGGAKGTCSSNARDGAFPWTCSGGIVANDTAEVETFLGISRGRLHQYKSALPSNGFRSGEPCAPAGSLRFDRVEGDDAACTGARDILWSPTPPKAPPAACGRSYATHFPALGGGWYQDACL